MINHRSFCSFLTSVTTDKILLVRIQYNYHLVLDRLNIDTYCQNKLLINFRCQSTLQCCYTKIRVEIYLFENVEYFLVGLFFAFKNKNIKGLLF